MNETPRPARALEESLDWLIGAVARGDHREAVEWLNRLSAADTRLDVAGRHIVSRWEDRARAYREGTAAEDPLGAGGAATDFRGLFGVLLRSSVDGVVLNALESRWMLEASDSFCELTGYERRELIGRTSVELGIIDADEVRREATARADEGVEGLYETRLRRKDGSERWVEFSHQMLGSELVLTIARDVTGRHLLEARLRSQRRSAEEAWRAAEAAKTDAERARVEANAANRAKSEFLSRMSHELRTPLHAVLGFAQVLEFDPLTNDQRDAVAHISKAGTHLLDLINEVLDISRIETGDLALSQEPVAVAEVTAEALDLVRPMAADRSITLLVDGGVADTAYVFADRQRLKQVLLNLLTNAVKYNRPEGRVTLSCESPDGLRLRIRVTDTGPGLQPDQIDRVFVPFERLGAEHTDVEGTGMGLAVAHRLTEMMGGVLDVVSAPGAGSTFWVELPVVEAPVQRYERMADDAPGPSDAPAPGAVHAVLYIEDNLANLKLAQRIFDRRPDIVIVPAMHGRLGLDLARARRPAVILLDLHLPDLSGEEVLRQLLADPVTARIPVVVLSADATPGRIDRLRTSGARGYLTKPFNVTELLQLVDDLIAEP